MDQPTFERPTPIRLPASSPLRRAARRAETVAAFSRHLSGAFVRRRLLRQDLPPGDVAQRLRHAFDDLGSTYTKFGQLIASSPGAFGQETAAAFRSLLDHGEALTSSEVERIVETELGAPISETFTEFDPAPIAAASMAVVHRAVLRDGRVVAVKVLRPQMAADAALDLDLMLPMFRRLGVMGVEVAGMLYRYVAGFRRQVAEELDLRNEARTMLHFRRLLVDAGLAEIAIPEPVEAMTTSRVLVMEFLEGAAIDDLDAIATFGADPRPLVRALLDFWFLTGLRDGVFHGDIHAGNLMLLRDGRLGLLDWGIVGVLDDRTRTVFRQFVAAVLGDTAAWGAVAEFMTEMLPFMSGDDDLLQAGGGRISELLTKPFADVDFGAVLRGDDENGPAGLRRRRAALGQQGLRTGAADSEFGQSNFLLFKQLIYFDRYGKLYLGDEGLISERPLLRAALDES